MMDTYDGGGGGGDDDEGSWGSSSSSSSYDAGDDRLLPVWISDGYFTLLPGESKNLSIQLGGGFEHRAMDNEFELATRAPFDGSDSDVAMTRSRTSSRVIAVQVDGWNVDPVFAQLT